MARPHSTFLRRQSRHPAGWASGGGETGFNPQPQPTLFTVTLTDSQVKDVILPKGTLVLAAVVVPGGPTGTDDFDKPTGGNVTIDNVTDSTSVLGSTSATSYSRTAISTPSALSAAKKYRFTAVTVLPATTGVVKVGIEAIMPTIHP